MTDGTGDAGQLRRRPERRHRAGDGRAGAPHRAGRGGGVARPAAAARRGDHADDRGARRHRRLRPARAHRRCPRWPTCARSTCSTSPAAGPAAGSPSPPATPPDEGSCASSARCAPTPRGRPATPAGCSTAAAPLLIPELPERGAERYPDDPAAAALFDAAAAAVGDGRAGAGPRAGARRADAAHPASLRPPLRPARRAPGRGPRRAGRAGRRQRPALRDRARRRGDPAAQPAAGRAGRRRACRSPPATWSGWTATRSAATGTTCCTLPDGAVGIAVGDVVGHDLRAAAAMGQLRGVVRSYAWDGGQPGSVLDRCDQLVQGLEMAAMATAVYARLDPPDPDGTRDAALRQRRATRRRCCSTGRRRSCGSTATTRR